MPDASAQKTWPEALYLVRHGESGGNVARDLAEAAKHPVIDIADRDMDVPLSALGERQAAALGAWFGAFPDEARPTVILSSPYVRACSTATIVRRVGGLSSVPIITDERLREKEFGILDRLTRFGIIKNHPDQAEFRRLLGKFYHRPPGGESWCDVILRLRGVIDTITRDHRGERVLIVSHQVVVSCMRYLLERMTEAEILAIDRETEIANCSVTEYAYDASIPKHGGLSLKVFNFVAPLEAAGEKVTKAPDAQVGPK